MIYCTSVYEDEITHQIMLRLYNFFQDCFSELRAIPCHGNGKIKKQIKAYNFAAQYGYFFIITDLDDDYECAPSLIKDWLPDQRSGQLIFRVVVHEIESWLLADRENFASFFSISKHLVPLQPDNEVDPKSTIISLAKRSRKEKYEKQLFLLTIMQALVPDMTFNFKVLFIKFGI